MSASIAKVFLRDGASGELVAAELYDEILPHHLQQVESLWRPVAVGMREEHGHWDWRAKMTRCAGQLRYRSFAIQAVGLTQGLMIVNTIGRCRLPSQHNRHLVYIEYLETAPWNRLHSDQYQSYKGVGVVLVAAAIRLSEQEGNKGRIALHSLPQSEEFYRHRCNLTDVGLDFSGQAYPLRYFEATEAQARQFLEGT